MNDRHIQKEHSSTRRGARLPKNQCDKLAENGKRCEREAYHRSKHRNKWCPCGRFEKYSGRDYCLKCSVDRNRKYQRGEGAFGLISRFVYLLSKAKISARDRKYEPPNITAEELVIAWERQGGSRNDLLKVAKCAWTDRLVTLYEATVEHNHETGEFRGFVCDDANKAEGKWNHMNRMTPQERALFIERVWPETAALIRAIGFAA